MVWTYVCAHMKWMKMMFSVLSASASNQFCIFKLNQIFKYLLTVYKYNYVTIQLYEDIIYNEIESKYINVI